ncbi:PA0061/PA0062 family lipoprotein [Pseudomonas huanghezhanensis]|uniref:PA0061/PA0062 family lipoprotein n=1 Tax=Pseudomonas huanghezhanensis TaxID=3002903 RepID=UPI002285784E|nr:hypothetical protein [Pseudomonas sp. BSw22131]
MRPLPLIVALGLLGGCASPLPPVDPQQAWIDLHTFTGKLVMADKLDGKRTEDGRYFQVTPGRHELQVRYDYEYAAGGLGLSMDIYNETTCYVTVRYDNFEAGRRYRLEVRDIANSIDAELKDEQRKVLAEESDVFCMPW